MGRSRRVPKPTGEIDMSNRRTATAIRLPADLHDQLVAAAEERMVSANWLVIKALEDFLPRLIPVDELTLVRSK